MDKTKPFNTNAAAMVVVAAVTIGGTLALTAPFVFLKTPLPYMATPSKKLRKALEYLKKHNNADHFVDLGSGDGEAIIQAASLGYKQCRGVELNSTLWVISRIRLLRELSSMQRKHATIKLGDLFEQPLHQADAVMIFGVKPLMKRISNKLRKECKPGAHVLSYRFPLPLEGVSSSDQKKTKSFPSNNDDDNNTLLNAEIVYDKEEMRIYKVL
jgi:hypothetical protein